MGFTLLGVPGEIPNSIRDKLAPTLTTRVSAAGFVIVKIVSKLASFTYLQDVNYLLIGIIVQVQPNFHVGIAG